jgi:putative SOS response-associated peptidase YedK
MCNLYRLETAQAAMRAFANAMRDHMGNLQPSLDVAPDRVAPVVITSEDDGERELTPMRWGFPNPQPGGQLVTNIREPLKKFWLDWLQHPEYRCVVPATAFSEWEDTKPKKTVRWFALDESQPLFWFAGIWRPWEGVRGTKKEPAEGKHKIFSFLTTNANSVVYPIHPKAMPVILTKPDEIAQWLEAPTQEALELQRPLPDDGLVLLPLDAPGS